MPRTVDSLSLTGYPTTLGAVDYGFDANLYVLRDKAPPNEQQLESLARVYASLLEAGKRTALHTRLVNGALSEFVRPETCNTGQLHHPRRYQALKRSTTLHSADDVAS